VGRGRLSSVIDRSYPRTEAPAAIRYLVERGPWGRVVVAI
jgi:hypothetical protein